MNTNTNTAASTFTSQFITTDLQILTESESDQVNVFKRLRTLGFAPEASYYGKEPDTSQWVYWHIIILDCAAKTYTRRSDRLNPIGLMTVNNFLSKYPAPQPDISPTSAPQAPLNPPNFVVNTGGNETLSRIVQELAFDAGLAWTNGSKKVTNTTSAYLYVIRGEKPFPFEVKGIMHSNGLSPTSPADQWPLYNAATQMGEIVRLLASPLPPPPPTPPELHGYKAVYSAGAPTVNFGCAKIGKSLLQNAAKLMGCVINSDGSVMKDAGIVPEEGCNRSVVAITLCSGKTLYRYEIAAILDYIAAVEKYAKDHPQSTPSK